MRFLQRGHNFHSGSIMISSLWKLYSMWIFFVNNEAEKWIILACEGKKQNETA